MEPREQLRKLAMTLELMDKLLETILHLQFGIQDKEWIGAILAIEDGHSRATQCIQRLQAEARAK